MSQSSIGEQILENLDKLKFKTDREKQNMLNVKKEANYLSRISKTDATENNLIEASQMQDEDFSKMNLKYIDLESLSFSNGAHHMTNEKCNLPTGSWRLAKKGYDEIYVPALKNKKEDIPLIQISRMPDWTQHSFHGIKNLNIIQSKVYECALNSSENMLICAPTGAGKTNIALLTMLQVIGSFRRADGSIDKDRFKIVYIAPMKALVAEMVGNFSKRLEGKLQIKIIILVVFFG